MTDQSGNDPDDSGSNPFKGTPFEQFFGAMGGMGGLGGATGGAGMPDLSQLFGQIQSMLQPYDGPLNWDLALDTARKAVATEPDPTPTQRQKDAVADALRLADHWLDETTSFPSGVTSTTAWSRAEWIVGTTDTWKVLVEPVATQSVQSLASALPEEARAVSGPILGVIGKAMGAVLATQIGSGLGALAGEVWGATDVGIPLTQPGRAALVVANVESFAEGLDVSADDVLLYLALREAAHQRLFAHVPWLREHLIGAVTDYASGVQIDTEAIQARVEEQIRGADLNDPASLEKLMDGGLFDIPEVAGPAGRVDPPRGHPGPGRGLGRRGRRAGHRHPDARGRQDAGGRTPPPGRRRPRRGHLRHPGRPRAASSPPARRLHALGLPADPSGRRGPRRRVDPPRPAAQRRRPRRPPRVPRGGRRAGEDERGPVRRRARALLEGGPADEPTDDEGSTDDEPPAAPQA